MVQEAQDSNSLENLVPLIRNLTIQLNEALKNENIYSDFATQLLNASEALSEKMSGDFLKVLKHAEKLVDSAGTCQELSDFGFTESGMYPIDPDGHKVGAEPIMVHCNFTTNTTEIIHDHDKEEIEMKKCEKLFNGEGCYKTSFEYDAPLSQIIALTNQSKSCEQDVKFHCFLAPLMEYGSKHLGFWLDRNGTQQTFFHGNFNESHTCQCGMNQTCLEPPLTCNCNAKIPEWLADMGKITDKNLLPVTEFAYGPMDYDIQKAKVQVGSLKCSGIKEKI